MAEYIERESAIETFMGEFPDAHYPSWYAEKLKELPTADVAEVRHGEWKWDKRFSDYTCSLCGNWDLKTSNYCSNCGADMRGEKHETL